MLLLMYELRHTLKDITDDIQTLLLKATLSELEIVVDVAKLNKLEHVQPIQA